MSSSKLKVLYVIDSFATGGAEKSLLTIIPRMRSAESVVCGIYADDSLLAQYREAGIRTIHFGLRGKYEWRKAFRMLSEVIEREQPHVIHSSLYRSNILSRFLARKYRIRLVTSLVSDSYGDLRKGQMSAARRIKLLATRFLDSRTVGYVDLFIANSRSIADSNGRILGIPEKRIEVVYRGRESADFTLERMEEVESIKRSLGLDAGQFVFLNVGRLIPGKGQLDLIRVMPEIVRAYPRVKLLIAGEGPFRAELEKAIAENGLDAYVTLLGNRNDIPALLKLAHVFVFPTYYEGHSGALLEAMFSDIPIVASDIGPNTETLDETTGTLFSVGRIPELKAAMLKSIAHYDEMKQKSAKARQHALKHFEISQVASSYEALYHRLIENRPE